MTEFRVRRRCGPRPRTCQGAEARPGAYLLSKQAPAASARPPCASCSSSPRAEATVGARPCVASARGTPRAASASRAPAQGARPGPRRRCRSLRPRPRRAHLEQRRGRGLGARGGVASTPPGPVRAGGGARRGGSALDVAFLVRLPLGHVVGERPHAGHLPQNRAELELVRGPLAQLRDTSVERLDDVFLTCVYRLSRRRIRRPLPRPHRDGGVARFALRRAARRRFHGGGLLFAARAEKYIFLMEKSILGLSMGRLSVLDRMPIDSDGCCGAF